LCAQRAGVGRRLNGLSHVVAGLTSTTRYASCVQRVRKLRTFVGVDADTHYCRPTRYFLLTPIDLDYTQIFRLQFASHFRDFTL